MIKSLHIKNLQSHKDSLLEFDPGVNIIVGLSDMGKSAIARALIWVINNKPLGDGFRRHNTDKTDVLLETGEAYIIGRHKSKSENSYTIGQEIFEAFKQGVPEVVSKNLNILPLNIQQQFDSSFLLASSSGEVARVLNQAVNLDIIDQALSNINKHYRDMNDDIKHDSIQIEELKETLEEYNHLPQMEKAVINLERLEHELYTVEQQQKSLYNFIYDYKEISSKIADLSTFLKIEHSVSDLNKKLQEHNTLIEKQYDLQELLVTIEDLTGGIVKNRQIMRSVGQVDLLNIKDISLKETNTMADSLNDLIGSIEKKQKNLDAVAKQLNNDTIEFDKLMPKKCPLCGK